MYAQVDHLSDDCSGDFLPEIADSDGNQTFDEKIWEILQKIDKEFHFSEELLISSLSVLNDCRTQEL